MCPQCRIISAGVEFKIPIDNGCADDMVEVLFNGGINISSEETLQFDNKRGAMCSSLTDGTEAIGAATIAMFRIICRSIAKIDVLCPVNQQSKEKSLGPREDDSW